MLTFLVSTFCHHCLSHDLTLWPTQGNGSGDATAIVIVSLPGRALCFAIFIEGHMKLSPQLQVKKGVVREKASVSSGFEVAKVFLLFTQQQQQQHQHQRARGQPLPKHIDLFPTRATSSALPRSASFDCPLL